MNPLLSIIVPVYNVEKQIERCAVSLFSQTLKDIEYVFVNDGTPDNSMIVLNAVIRRYPEIQGNVVIVNHERNKGLSAARLTGIKRSSGHYIAHCDSDDWVEPNMYELMLDAAEKENADIVCSDIFFDSCTSIFEDKYATNIFTVNKLDYLSQMTLGGKFSALWNKLIKRTLYIDNDIYPVESISMWEDMVVTFRLIYHSNKTVIIHQPLYHYVFNNDSISSRYSKNHIIQQINCSQVIENFFLDKGKEESEKYYIPVQNLKFIAKSNYLTNKNTRDINLWKRISPESNKHIWKYKELSFFRRFIFWLAIIGFTKTSVKIMDGYIFYNLLNFFRK